MLELVFQTLSMHERGELSPIVHYEGIRNSMTTEVLLRGLNHGCRLDSGKLIKCIIVTAVVHCNQVGSAIEFKQVLRDQLPRYSGHWVRL